MLEFANILKEKPAKNTLLKERKSEDVGLKNSPFANSIDKNIENALIIPKKPVNLFTQDSNMSDFVLWEEEEDAKN